MEIYDTPSFLEVSAFSHLMEALLRLLSASVDSQLTSAQNNLYACQLKKLHNLKVETYVLFSGLAEDLSPRDSLSEGSEGLL